MKKKIKNKNQKQVKTLKKKGKAKDSVNTNSKNQKNRPGAQKGLDHHVPLMTYVYLLVHACNMYIILSKYIC